MKTEKAFGDVSASIGNAEGECLRGGQCACVYDLNYMTRQHPLGVRIKHPAELAGKTDALLALRRASKMEGSFGETAGRRVPEATLAADTDGVFSIATSLAIHSWARCSVVYRVRAS
jgi:hypothetical protein